MMLMEQREAEEREMKRREMAGLRETWALQASQPKNQAAKMCDPVVPEACGTAALQRFKGEVSSMNSCPCATSTNESIFYYYTMLYMYMYI